MAEEKVEAPKRIWLPRATLDHGGGSIYIGQAWDDNDTEYVRVDRAPNTRQRAERAAEKVIEARLDLGLCKLLDGTTTDELRVSKLTDIIAAEFEK